MSIIEDYSQCGAGRGERVEGAATVLVINVYMDL